MQFIVEEQELERVDNKKIASFAKDYVSATILFDENWSNLQKFALFVLPSKTRIIEEIGSEDEVKIIVPQNALMKTYFQLSVFGKNNDGVLLTSTQEKVIVHPSGFDEDLVEQIFDEEVFILEDSEKEGKLKRLEKDIYWFIPNKKLLHRNEHNYP